MVELTFLEFNEKQKKEVRDISYKINVFGNPSANNPSTAAIVLETNDWFLGNSWNGSSGYEDSRKRFLSYVGLENTKESPQLIGAYLNITNFSKSLIGTGLALGNLLGNKLVKKSDLDDNIERKLENIFPVHPEETFSSAYFWKFPISGTIGRTAGVAISAVPTIFAGIYGFTHGIMTKKQDEPKLYSN